MTNGQNMVSTLIEQIPSQGVPNEISVILPGAPCLKMEEIIKLQETGALSFEESSNMLRLIAGAQRLQPNELKRQLEDKQANEVQLAAKMAKAEHIKPVVK